MPSDFTAIIEIDTLQTRADRPLARFDHISVLSVGFGHSPSNSNKHIDFDKEVASTYTHYGDTLTAHLVGQHAGVIVDRLNRKVLLFQDSLGVRTVFYTVRKNEIAVSSNLKMLMSLVRPTALNAEFFAEYLGNARKPYFDTPFAGIQRLGLGTTTIFQGNRRFSIIPWSPSTAEIHLDPDDACVHLRSLVDEAVGTMMPLTGNVLCDLSGGLDSTTVLLTALRVREVQAFTWTNGIPGDHDEKFAKDVVSLYGLRQHVINRSKFPPYSLIRSEFAAEPGNELLEDLLTQRLELLKREKIDVSLTGYLGDCVFGSSGGILAYHVADAICAGRILIACQLARELSDHFGGQRAWTHWLVHFGVSVAWRHFRWRSLQNANAPPPWISREFMRRHQFDKGPGPQRAPRVREAGKQYLWETVYSDSSALSCDFRTQHGHEVRHPLMHRPLVEFMLAVDPRYRYSPSSDRVLQRLALADRLPSFIIQRQGKGGPQEVNDRAFYTSAAWCEMLTDSPRLAALGWIDLASWKATVAAARFGAIVRRPEFEAAMKTERWLRNYELANLPSAPKLAEFNYELPVGVRKSVESAVTQR